jgi:hypothetical protein
MPRPATMALFALTWLATGFAAGTLTLLGPVRWVTTGMRSAGAGELTEKLVVAGIIAAYVLVSFVATVFVVRAAVRSGGWARVIAPAAAWVAAGFCLWLWMTPAVVNSFQPVQIDTVAGFTFGPYPERERFEQLRAEGYTGVVSLLHPAVIPFEPQLIARERELAKEFGIELIHAPMLPWVGDNAESLETLRALAARRDGRYYVHCYLGRDRVGTVRALIERTTSVAVLGDIRGDAHVLDVEFTRRTFERGEIVELEPGVFLGPFPTDEEMFNYFVSGTFAHIVSLLDPENPDDRQWIEKENEVLERYGIPHSLRPVPWSPLSVEHALAAARHVRRLPRPVMVHAFRSDAVAAEAFAASYRTDLPAVSSRYFEEPMAGGTARVLAPNVVLGPRPAGPEFGSYLGVRGIRSIAYVGDSARRRPAGRDPGRGRWSLVRLRPGTRVDPRRTGDAGERAVEAPETADHGRQITHHVAARTRIRLHSRGSS